METMITAIAVAALLVATYFTLRRVYDPLYERVRELRREVSEMDETFDKYRHELHESVDRICETLEGFCDDLEEFCDEMARYGGEVSPGFAEFRAKLRRFRGGLSLGFAEFRGEIDEFREELEEELAVIGEDMLEFTWGYVGTYRSNQDGYSAVAEGSQDWFCATSGTGEGSSS